MPFVSISDITAYRNGDKTHYGKQAELDELVKKQVKRIKKKEEVELTEMEPLNGLAGLDENAA